MSHVQLRNLVIPRNQLEDRPGLFRVRRPGSEHHGHHNRWQDTEGNHTHTSIHPEVQLEPPTRGLEGDGSSSSAPPTPQRSIPMQHGQQEVQPSFTLGRNGIILPEGCRKTQLPSGFKPFRHQKISGQDSTFFTIPGTFQEKTRIKGKEEDFFQPKEERVRPNDTEAVGLGERIKPEPETVVNTSNRIRSPSSRNITPTQMEHSVFIPESNINSN
ncbi:hypothetical protein O181_013537 [Austropuccinia psidii MF-1]|uniref:Uncharacterized protein n=1 Tax=Austropuccinia psidii MF-1 TaxID=1389203 RepID=A0A9Q3BZU7_9BASI|nr:hypothetical protein [Austropuccinia psidii MF-1]